MPNLFMDPTKSLPKEADSQIVRVGMKQNEIGGRTDHIPNAMTAREMAIQHVPNVGSRS